MSAKVEFGLSQKVLVTEVTTSGGQFFVQLDTPEAYQVQDLSREIEAHVEQNRDTVSLELGSQCFACASDGVWYRAMVLEKHARGEVTVFYVDYGNSERVKTSQLRAPSSKFFELPHQALCCMLSDFTPTSGKWTEALASYLTEHILNQEFTAIFRSRASQAHLHLPPVLQDRLPCYNLTLYQDEEVQISFSEVLVGEGFGQYAICSENVSVGMKAKVFISFSDSPGGFWLQLSEKVEALEGLVMSFLRDESFIACLQPLPSSAVFTGVACCTEFADDKLTYRAEVVSKVGKGRVEVQFVDYGNRATVPVSSLRALPPHLCTLPAQAIQCCLEGVRPAGKDWSTAACDKFSELISAGVELEAEFVDALTPDVFDVVLTNPETGEVISEVLIRSGYVLSSEPPPLQNSSSLLPPPSHPLPLPLPLSPPSDRKPFHLEVGQQYRVIVSALESPSVVWCQLSDHQDTFNSMMTKLAKKYANPSAVPGLQNPAPEQMCCAQFSCDRQWYRGKVIAVDPASKQAEVLFIDYGNTEVVKFSSLKELSSEFTAPEPQALSFSMFSLSPADGSDTWSAETVQKFHELATAGELLCSVVELDGDGYPAARVSDQQGDIGDRLIKMRLARGREVMRKGREGSRPVKSYQQDRRERGRMSSGSGDSSPRRNQDSSSQQGARPHPPAQSPLQSKSQSTLQPKGQSPVGTKPGPPSPRATPLKYITQSLREGQEYKMVVVHVDSLLDFYVQLASSSELDALMKDIARHCLSSAARAAAQLALGKPVLAQFSEDQVWYRAVVSERKQADVCVVTFVDYGNSDTLHDSSLKEIPPQYVSLPAQAVHCSLHGVGIQASAETAKIAFTELALEQEATGIVKKTRSDDLEETVYSVELTLSDGSKVIDALVERGHVSIPRASLSHLSPTSSPMLTEIKLPDVSVATPVDVCVSFVESPEKFYVQLLETSDHLKELTRGMEEIYSKLTEREEILFSLDTGVFCAAKFQEDGVWYRAKIMSMEESRVRVWFVDYGNEDIAQASDLKSLRMQFAVEPCLSIPCTLEGLSSSAAQSPSVAKRFAEFVTREGTKLVAQFAKPFTTYSEIVPVKLFDTSQPGVDQDVATLLEEMHSGSKSGQSQFSTRGDETISEPTASSSRPEITIPSACPSFNTPLSCSVTHVNSPSDFYCQLKATATSADDLLNSLYLFYGEGETGVPLSDPAVGRLCAAPFSGDGSWYRAKITSLTPETATVVYIDYGNSEGVSVADLRVLDTQFCHESCLALRCSLNEIDPVQSTAGWDEESCTHLSDAILDQECQLTILEEGQEERFRVELELNGSAVAEMLVSKGLAKMMPSASLEEPIPPVSSFSAPTPAIPPCSLETGRDYDVFVTYSSSPSHLYCQLKDQDGAFGQLAQEIEEYCTTVPPVLEGQEWANGDIVLAQFSEDQTWYRARITNIATTGKSADILFVDYGNAEHTTTMRPILEEFCSTPIQAALCQLEEAEQYTVLDEEAFNKLVTVEESGFKMRVIHLGSEKVVVSLTLVSDGRSVLEYGVERGVLGKRGADEEEGGGEGGRGGGGGGEGGEGGGGEDAVVREEGEDGRVESGLEPMPVAAGSKEEVFVSHIESPVSFWVQMAFTEPDLTAVGGQLETVYGNPDECQKLALPDPKPGQACCAQFSQDQQWYRSIIESVDSSGVKVHFVDWGNSETVPATNILLLKQEFLDTPCQAIHCQLADAFPVGTDWSDRSITCFSSLILDKALSAQFLSELSSGVWSVRLLSQNEDIATAMMKKGAAAPRQVSSTTQDTTLENSTENLPGPPTQNIPESLPQRVDAVPTIPDLVLKEGESYEVYISHATTTPTEFYCQLADNSTSLDELMAAIADFYTENSPPPTLKAGLFCVAQYSGNNAWYRAKITDVGEEEGGGVLVHFVDYGNCETVSQEQVLGLHPNLAALACQAFCCSLSDDLSLQLPAEKMEQFLSLDFDQCFRVFVTSCLNDRYVVSLSNLEGASLNDILLSSDEAESPVAPNSFASLSSSYKHLSYALSSTLDVYVSHLDSPVSFFCQPLELAADLEAMMTELAETVTTSPPPLLTAVSDGQPCLAQFSEDGEWYRAQIESRANEDEFISHFVDYGNSEVTTLASLRELPTSLLKAPVQSIHCSVFEPTISEEWSPEKVEEFRAMLGDGPLSLTITGTAEDGLFMCEVCANGEPLDFTPLLSSPLETETTAAREPIPATTGLGEMSQERGGSVGDGVKDRSYYSSASSSSLPPDGASLLAAVEGEGVRKPTPLSTTSSQELDASVLGTVSANISTMAVRGSNPSSEAVSDTETSEEASEQGEGEPLIKAPFTLTLSIPEQFEATVVYVESPSLLYLQRVDIQPELEKLSSEIEQYCLSFAEKQYQEIFHKGDFVLAQFSANNAWYRAKVMAVCEDGTAQVLFIDYGNTELIPPEQMIMCPENLLELPCQAIACSLSSVPRRESWPDEYKNLIDKLVTEHVMKVRVVHPASEGMMPTVTMEDLETGVDIAQKVLDHLQEECDRGNVSNYVIPEEPEGEYPNGNGDVHNGVGETPTVGITSSPPSIVPERVIEMGSRQEVYVVSCDSPHSFMCQLASETEELEAMVAALEETYASPDSAHLLLTQPAQIGDWVCARFSRDNLWYRAKVVGLQGDENVELLYVDYGNTETVPLSSVRVLDPSLPTCPPLAMECYLAGTEVPEGAEGFSSEAAEKLLALVGEESCSIEVLFTDSAGHYGVNLFSSEGVNVADALIEAHLVSVLKDTPTTATLSPPTVTSDVTPEAVPANEGGDPVITELSESPLPTDEGSKVTPQVPKDDSVELSVEVKPQPVLAAMATDKAAKPDEQVPTTGPDSVADSSSLNHFATCYSSKVLQTGSTCSARITSITSLDLFHCQLTGYEEALDTLTAAIASQGYVAGDGQLAVENPTRGQPVCACRSHDNTWCRAEISSVLSPRRARVFYVDHGNTEDIDLSRVKLLKREFSESVPPQVLKCSLPPLTDCDLDPSRPVDDAWDLVWPTSCLEHFRELVKEGKEVRLVLKEEGEGGVWVVRVMVSGEGEEEVDVRAAMIAKLAEPKTMSEEEEGDREREEGDREEGEEGGREEGDGGGGGEEEGGGEGGGGGAEDALLTPPLPPELASESEEPSSEEVKPVSVVPACNGVSGVSGDGDGGEGDGEGGSSSEEWGDAKEDLSLPSVGEGERERGRGEGGKGAGEGQVQDGMDTDQVPSEGEGKRVLSAEEKEGEEEDMRQLEEQHLSDGRGAESVATGDIARVVSAVAHQAVVEAEREMGEGEEGRGEEGEEQMPEEMPQKESAARPLPGTPVHVHVYKVWIYYTGVYVYILYVY